MLTITEMQTQIKEMSSRMDQFARELLDYNQTENNTGAIDFKHIKAIGARNPITGHILEKVDESIKKKYIIMLIALVYMAKENQENAWLLVQRIAAGAGFMEELIDLSVDAVNITDAQIDEFTLSISSAELNNIFALDAMLVYLSCEHADDKMLIFLAALFELIQCKKKDVRDLTELAQIIAEENSGKYVELLKVIKLKLSDYYCYVNEFYYGIQSYDLHSIYYKGNGTNEITKYELEQILANSGQILIEDAVICLRESLTFEGKDKIIFKKCTFVKSEHCMNFTSASSVEFDTCTFMDMSNRVATINNLTSFIAKNCSFIRCGFLCDGDKTGGVFEVNSNMESIQIINCKFNACYIKSRTYRSNYGVSGCILVGNYNRTTLLHIENCEFVACECINNGNYTDALFYHIYRGEELINNNIVTGKKQEFIC